MSRKIKKLPEGVTPALADTVARIAAAAAELQTRIARGGLDEDLADSRGENKGGDTQKALDVIADDSFRKVLAGGVVRHYASEEQSEVVEIEKSGSLALAIDPLDGSSNIDTNVSIGTIFGIYPALDDPNESFLRPGSDLLASGYVIYGPQCCLVITFGDGILKFVLDPKDRVFKDAGRLGPIPSDSAEYAINASNYRHWPAQIRSYIDDRIAGVEGPAGQDFNMRWIASLVAETHRILTRGGIFLYPGDNRPTHQHGRLRLVYECAPIGFLIEQAGGNATDAADPIRERIPQTLHARTPFVFGSADKVVRVATYMDLPEEESSALFGKRGLFRS